jgi:hypothetical protein
MKVLLLKAVPKSRLGKFVAHFKKELIFVRYVTFVLQVIDREQTKLAAVLYYCGK